MKTLFLSFLLLCNGRENVKVNYICRDESTGKKMYELFGQKAVYQGLFRDEVIHFARNGNVEWLGIYADEMMITNVPIYGFEDRPIPGMEIVEE